MEQTIWQSLNTAKKKLQAIPGRAKHPFTESRKPELAASSFGFLCSFPSQVYVVSTPSGQQLLGSSWTSLVGSLLLLELVLSTR